jgi:hypothetical protein
VLVVPGSATVAVEATSTAPVTLTWYPSTGPVPSPGPYLASSVGSETLSGQTSYTVSVAISDFGSTQPQCNTATFYDVVSVTATGSDGQSMSSFGVSPPYIL